MTEPTTWPERSATTSADKRWRALSELLATLLMLLPIAAVAQPFFFVTDIASNEIAIIDTATLSQVGSLPVGALPTGAAVDPAGMRLYVANSGENTVSILDLDTGGSETVAVGSKPIGVAVSPAGDRVYVANAGANTVSVIDTAANSVIATVPVSAEPIDLATGGSFVYIATHGGNSLYVIDAASNMVADALMLGGLPAGVAVSPAGDFVYVSQFFDNTVTVLETAFLGTVATIPVGNNPRGVVVSPAGDRAYVGNFGSGDVSVIDTSSNTVVATTSVGVNPTDLVMTPQGDRLFVASLYSEVITVIDTATTTTAGEVVVGLGHIGLAGFANQAPVMPPSVPIPTLSGWGLMLGALLLMAIGARWLRGSGGRILVSPLLAFTALAGLSLPERAAAQQVVIFDGEFFDENWEILEANITGIGRHEFVRNTLNGNPGAYREMLHDHDTEEIGGTIEVLHQYAGPGAAYDSGTQGAISTIDFSWDARVFFDDGFPVEQGIFLSQDETLYTVELGEFSNGDWMSFIALNLTPADFTRFSPMGPAQPDFSTGGAPLRFGYLRRTMRTVFDTLSGQIHDIDNFRVTINQVAAGEPGILRFARSQTAVIEGNDVVVTVFRTGGSAGAVSAQIALAPGGTADGDFDFNDEGFPFTLDWADGETAGKDISFSTFATDPSLPPPPVKTVHLTLGNTTGGASVDLVFNQQVVQIHPAIEELLELLTALLALLFSFDGVSLLLFAPPAIYLAYRRSVSSAETKANKPDSAP